MDMRNSLGASEGISNGVKNKIFKFTLSLSIFVVAGFFVVKEAKAVGSPAHLWHFNECSGSSVADYIGSDNFNIGGNAWSIGKWNCGLKQYYSYNAAQVNFNQAVDADNLTLSFYYKFLDNGSRLYFRLTNSLGQQIKIIPTPSYTEIYGLPTSFGVRLNKGWPADSQWHQIVLSIEAAAGQWKLYLDGNEFYSYSGNAFNLPEFNTLEIKGDNNYNWIDEAALWSNVLTLAEIQTIYQLDKELEPPAPIIPADEKKMLNLWQFDEGQGSVIADTIGQTTLPQNAGWTQGKWASGLYQSWQTGQRISADLNQTINARDLTLEFWWKNSSFPNEARGKFYLEGASGQLGIIPSIVRTTLITPYGNISLEPSPLASFNDANWHHLALVLNSSGYSLDFYIDTQKVYTQGLMPLNFTLSSIHFYGENFPYSLDEFTIWQGALSQQDIADYYNSGQPHKKPGLDPVILVPGIMGSYLYDSNWGEVWMNLDKMVLNIFDDDYLNYLKMDENGNSINNIVVEDVVRSVEKLKIINIDILNGLIDTLEADGYEENKDLFVFPYDWRQSIDLTAVQLNQKILDVLSQTGSQKVNIIAHSMGGLVAKAYMKAYMGQDKINKFIDIATPHFGAPKAFKVLKYGDNLGIKVILSENRIKIISQNMPSVYELLPNASYYDSGHIDYNFVYSDQGFQYDYNDMNSYLGIWNNPLLVDEAKEFHNNIDDYNSYAGNTQTYNIIGCGFATLGKITKLNKEKDHNEYRLDYISGDGTVPLKSAEGIPAYRKYYYNGVEHISLPSANGITQLVGSILDDKESQFDLSPYPISTRSDICQIRGKIVTYHSPIALHVYDEDGRHVGPDAGGDIDNQIPGAQYDIIEDNKFVFLPPGHTYRIVGQATGIGAFNSRIETIDNGLVTQTAYYNQIPITTTNTNVEMTVIDNQTDYTMKIDQDGDQAFEAIVQPSSILDEQGSADVTKPETNINISGTQGDDNWYVSTAQISLTASDNEGGSGILKTEYSLDDGQTWQIYTDTINIDKQGANKILFKSTDRAGNIEEEKTIEFKIDTIMPISDSILIGAMGQNNWHTSDVQVSLYAEDNTDGSGVDKIEYSADNGSTWQIYGQAIVIYNDGKSNILYRAVDKAGNQTDNKEIAVQIDQTPPTLEMIAPLADDEYDHAEDLEILYNGIDSTSGLNDADTKIQINGQNISTTSIDLFSYHMGSHQLTIEAVDLAGNQTAITIPFSVVTSIPGAIDDIKRLYSEKQIAKVSARDKLIKELNGLQQYIERFGKRQDKRLSKYQERLAKCDKRKRHAANCRESVKKLYERREYILDKVHAKIVANRFADLLKDLEKFYSKKWLTLRAYEMIKEELIYLKNNL